MLDLNAHLLPGIHPSTPTITESLAAARALVASGVTAAVCPVTISGDVRAEMDAADRAREDLRQALISEDVPLEILSGVLLPMDRIADLSDDLLREATLGGGGRWLLTALPDAGWPLRLNDLMTSLDMRRLGIVVAHPEWAESVQLAPDRLRDLLGRGSLIQVAAGSLAGLHGERAERTAFGLLRGGMATIIATDAPSHTDRTAGLDHAVDQVERVLRRPRTEVMWMVDAGPSLIVSGMAVRAPRLVPMPREPH
ncbi:MAG: hypothetical protein EXQ74_04120 [Thermoleophilia bacterium]|nr:hypothetical protein [Thermoleophilia bacterium]